MNYFPNYYSIEDIFVTQEKVECRVNTKLQRMGEYRCVHCVQESID